jgi:hypothetical protein
MFSPGIESPSVSAELSLTKITSTARAGWIRGQMGLFWFAGWCEIRS